MALLYTADIRPSKIELIQEWAPTRPWFPSSPDAELTNVGAYRFDDPEGEVGIETILVQIAGGAVVQVPLTYRGAALEGGEASLITTMTHSVLGDRWVYDGAGDPAYVAATATAIFTGGSQAELLVSDGSSDTLARREPTAIVAGTGTDTTVVPAPRVADITTHDEGDVTIVEAGGIRLAIARVVSDGALDLSGSVETLTGTWADQATGIALVAASRV